MQQAFHIHSRVTPGAAYRDWRDVRLNWRGHTTRVKCLAHTGRLHRHLLLLHAAHVLLGCHRGLDRLGDAANQPFRLARPAATRRSLHLHPLQHRAHRAQVEGVLPRIMQRPRVGRRTARVSGRVKGRVGFDEPAQQHGTLGAAHEWRVPEAVGRVAQLTTLATCYVLLTAYYLLHSADSILLTTCYTLLTRIPEAVERVAGVAQLLLMLLGGGRAPTLLLGGGGLRALRALELRHE